MYWTDRINVRPGVSLPDAADRCIAPAIVRCHAGTAMMSPDVGSTRLEDRQRELTVAAAADPCAAASAIRTANRDEGARSGTKPTHTARRQNHMSILTESPMCSFAVHERGLS